MISEHVDPGLISIVTKLFFLDSICEEVSLHINN